MFYYNSRTWAANYHWSPSSFFTNNAILLWKVIRTVRISVIFFKKSSTYLRNSILKDKSPTEIDWGKKLWLWIYYFSYSKFSYLTRRTAAPIIFKFHNLWVPDMINVQLFSYFSNRFNFSLIRSSSKDINY